jgi:ornithine--oxo-acid transaminase
MNQLSSADHIALTRQYSAPNYAPLEVVLTKGKGVWVWDVEGKRYLDMLSAYSAMNWGHCNERLLECAREQLETLTVTSRSFFNDQLGYFSKELAEFCGMEAVLIMNTGAEAVETAVKGSRRWGYGVKGIEAERAEIICFEGNFHGRTTTIISFSDGLESRRDFGPYTPGFVLVPYGDLAALEAAITPRTAAILVEPIQGEAGVQVPPPGFLKGIRALCDTNNVLMVADEIQTGLCRTGRVFACEHENVKPDMVILGKSLGGGLVPISAVAGRREIMELFSPGSHGSTFGGNPLACAIAREVLRLIKDERPHERSAELGSYLADELRSWGSKKIEVIRGRGLFVGLDIVKSFGKAKQYCVELMKRGILCKDTRDQTIRLAPPLVIEKEEIDAALAVLREVLG